MTIFHFVILYYIKVSTPLCLSYSPSLFSLTLSYQFRPTSHLPTIIYEDINMYKLQGIIFPNFQLVNMGYFTRCLLGFRV